MSKQLRYLLHGNKEKYEDITTPLYITSQESTVWQKVGQQVLQIRGEDWRLIDPLIVEYIPSAKRQILGIKLLQTEEVVDLIRELGYLNEGTATEAGNPCQPLAAFPQADYLNRFSQTRSPSSSSARNVTR